MSITLTEKQEKGLKIAIQRYLDHEKYTVISGYAGTGKSTLVKFIIQALPGIDPYTDVVYATFTGKAAQVLMSKGNQNALTLHKLLYESIPKSDGTFLRRKRRKIYEKVVVVDEVSMAPKEMMDLLFSYPNVYVICLGDPFQLPPIDKDADNHLLDSPHVFLDEVMRQAMDSEIIRLTMDIRNGTYIKKTEGRDVKIFNQSEMNTGMLLWADQIICGTNSTRVKINNTIRETLGRGEHPEDGDKVICLRNYWDNFADNGDFLVNGTIGFLKDPYPSFNIIPSFFCPPTQEVKTTNAIFISDTDADYGSLQMDQQEIMTGERQLDARTIYRLNRSKVCKSLVPMDFTYGYCITCHKAQGSEWDKVLVIEEGFPYNEEEHARWLYTAATRAINKLVIVR